MAKTGIVLELQRDCLDQNVSATTILRKAKVIAAKLDLGDLLSWINSELNGYQCSANELPEHRKGTGQPKFLNPYHGWRPIQTSDDWFGQAVRTVSFFQSASEIESLLLNESSSTLIMYYPPIIEEAIQKQLPARMETGLHFSKSEAIRVLDFIRNKTLEWSLELESRGVIGDGMSFDQKDRKEASAVTNHIYGGNFGVLGNVAGDSTSSGFVSISGNLSGEKIELLASQIRETLPALPEGVQAALEQPLSALEGEGEKATPSQGVVATALTSVKNALEGAAGNLAAAGILAAISSM